MESVDNSGLLFLFEEFDVGFGVLSDDVLDFAVICDSAHFLLNVDIEFVSNYMIF